MIKPTKVTKRNDDSLDVEFSNGTKGNIPGNDDDTRLVQAYLIYQILQTEGKSDHGQDSRIQDHAQ